MLAPRAFSKVLLQTILHDSRTYLKASTVINETFTQQASTSFQSTRPTICVYVERIIRERHMEHSCATACVLFQRGRGPGSAGRSVFVGMGWGGTWVCSGLQ